MTVQCEPRWDFPLSGSVSGTRTWHGEWLCLLDVSCGLSTHAYINASHSNW